MDVKYQFYLSWKFSSLTLPLDNHGNIVSPFKMDRIGDQPNSDELDYFWSHVEVCHQEKYLEIVAYCRSIMPIPLKIKKVRVQSFLSSTEGV